MDTKFTTNFMYDKDKYKIVIDYFCHILNDNFLMALSYFSNGISYGYDYNGVNFAIDNETHTKTTVFYDFDYEIIVNMSIFIHSLELACTIYIIENPHNKDEVIKLYKETCNHLL